MHKYITELIGALILSLVFNTTVHSGVGTIGALANGGILIGLILASSRISGAHFNPAVSLGVLVSGQMYFREFLIYVFFQIVGAVIGSFFGQFLLRSEGIIIEQARQISLIPGIMAEFIGTFMWVYVWLNVTRHFKGPKQAGHAMAVGFTFIAIFLAFSPISGGASNPGLAISLAVDGFYHYTDLYIHLIGEFIGAVAAASVFMAIQRGLEDEIASENSQSLRG